MVLSYHGVHKNWWHCVSARLPLFVQYFDLGEIHYECIVGDLMLLRNDGVFLPFTEFFETNWGVAELSQARKIRS
jgi:hypothetical protein